MCWQKPNIVFIMADDLGYGDLGCYGGTRIPTPNIDRLAREGVRFTDAHASSALCTPSRYSVLTGRYCWRTALKKGVLWHFDPPLLEPDRPTVASMLKRHGYATAAIGKWHLGLGWTTYDGASPNADGTNVDYHAPVTGGPIAHGFDESFAMSGSLGMLPYCFIENDRVVGKPSVMKSPLRAQETPGLMVPDWRDDEVDLQFTRQAVSFIEQHATEHPNSPFFLYLTPSAPHRPCVPPEFMRGASKAGPRGDMVAMVDWMVGKIDDTLEKLGLTEQTLLVVTSDNGAREMCHDCSTYGHRSNGDLRGQKADIWDGGHREPFVARWPGRIAPDTTCHQLVGLIDLYATCAEIVGQPLSNEEAEDSYSILPALLDSSLERPIRDSVVHHALDGMFSIRQGPWKMIAGLGSGGFTDPRRIEPDPSGPHGQLYHMSDDVGETTNLWQQRPDVVDRLSGLLQTCVDQGHSRPLSHTKQSPQQ